MDEIAIPQYATPQSNSSEDNSSVISKEVQAALNNLSNARKQPTLTNEDLGYIVNGREGELLQDRLFDFTMTEERILNCNPRVYIPN